MIECTISELLAQSAQKYQDAAALKFPAENSGMSFEQVKENADETSKALMALGLKRGEHIGIWSTNTTHWVSLALGAAQIGVVFVPLNIAYRRNEIEDLCRRSDIRYLFSADELRGKPTSEVLDVLFQNDAINAERFPKLSGVFSMSSDGNERIRGWKEFVESAGQVDDSTLQAAKDKVKKEDIYIIQYTSGTTAKPKGARLIQHGVLNTGNSYANLLRLNPEDSTCIPLPLYHCFGNVLTLLGGLISGSCSVYLPSFSARETYETLVKEQCTVFMGVPTMYTAVMSQPNFDGSKLNLKKAGIGGSYCPPALTRQIQEKMGLKKLVIGYGLSEAASLCTLSDVCAPEEKRLNTVGPALPGLEVSLYDVSHHQEDIHKDSGEIIVRGFGVMKDYYKDAEHTAEALDADGWLHTGDLGHFDEDGYLTVVGRLKDIIIRGGENISPSEIEAKSLDLPEIQDCQCVGVHDDVMIEEIAAFVILRAGQTLDPDVFRTYIGEHMSKYKVPRYVFFTDEFPINSSGKVLKNRLKEEAEKLVKTLNVK